MNIISKIMFFFVREFKVSIKNISDLFINIIFFILAIFIFIFSIGPDKEVLNLIDNFLIEKNSKKSSKTTYSKKKKIKKNILNGIAYVQSTFNNTIVSITDDSGNVIEVVNNILILYWNSK